MCLLAGDTEWNSMSRSGNRPACATVSPLQARLPRRKVCLRSYVCVLSGPDLDRGFVHDLVARRAHYGQWPTRTAFLYRHNQFHTTYTTACILMYTIHHSMHNNELSCVHTLLAEPLISMASNTN